MSVTIENKTNARVLLRLKSHRTVRLGPGEILTGVEHVEVKGNARIKQLEERHVIALRQTAEKKSSRSGDLSAAEAIQHIESTPLEELGDFLSSDENRATVIKAMEEKRTK